MKIKYKGTSVNYHLLAKRLLRNLEPVAVLGEDGRTLQRALSSQQEGSYHALWVVGCKRRAQQSRQQLWQKHRMDINVFIHHCYISLLLKELKLNEICMRFDYNESSECCFSKKFH